MQIPYRKPGEFTNIVPDPHLTRSKFNELTAKLNKLKAALPGATGELQRLAEMGDFSENAAYQMAKGRVRSINDKIFGIEEHLKNAIIIKPTGNLGQVQLGSRVTVSLSGKTVTYQILGSAEIDLANNIISHNSPIGAALLGKKAGESFTIRLGGSETTGKIIKVE
ncbi:MAG: GreA/GreB family elongation factor [Candidatus Komeilibacteria bacterium]|nr:GreA/GreB family elongation factor [Candidatus Komeilibacteria bacterium]